MRHPVSRTNFIRFISRLKFALIAFIALHISVLHHFSHDLIISHSFTFPAQATTHLLANVNVRYMSLPVRLSSVCLSSVTFVHPTQAIDIFSTVSTPFGTLAIY